MTKRIKAIPTTYKGIEFRSKLEAKYAQALDRLSIVWEYEGHGFVFDDGTCYAPDFYMPEIDTYLEVKGVMDEASKHKIELLADEGKRVVVGNPDGSLQYINNDEDSWVKGWSKYPLIVSCSACDHVFFTSCDDSYKCKHCGAWDGDRYIIYFPGDSDNIFRAVGW